MSNVSPRWRFRCSTIIVFILINIVEFLAKSAFLEDLDYIVRCFDKTTKLRFRSADEYQYVKFGSSQAHDANCNIRYGQLKMTGWVPCVTLVKLSILINLSFFSVDVASFFEPSIQCIVDAVREQRKMAHKKFTVSFSKISFAHYVPLIN